MNVNNIREFLSCEKGATAIEYGLIVALIVIASVSALTTMSSTVIQNFNDTSSRFVGALD